VLYSAFAVGRSTIALLYAVGNFFPNFSAAIPPLQGYHRTIRLKPNLATLAKVRILSTITKSTIVVAPLKMRLVATLTLSYFAAHITSKEIDNGVQQPQPVCRTPDVVL
jgi:hypothetical protein